MLFNLQIYPLVVTILNYLWQVAKLRVCLLPLFKQQFSVFKQYYIYFHTFFLNQIFYPHVFPKKYKQH